MMKNIFSLMLASSLFTFASCTNSSSGNLQNDSTDSISTATSDSVIVQNQNDTASFKATGTEPFWGLTISENKIVLDLIEDSIVVTTPIPETAVDTKIYHIANQETNLDIQIKMSKCENGMSGKVSPYTVTIRYKRPNDLRETILSGCGNYAADNPLDGSWILTQINGNLVKKSDENVVNLNINGNGSFSGFSGCNQINGELIINNSDLRFKDVASTKIFCGKDNVEAQFLALLNDVGSYKIKDGDLILIASNKKALIFKSTTR